jgi:TolB-like protein/Tfp pilus assembly protein PilF
MPEKPGNLEQFWQELKRRKVIRVIIVYAAASFVILELASIIQEPFGLPDWTIKLVFVILCVGLAISIILSWIFDITPEGIEKTKPPQDVSKEDKPASSKSWKIASYISFVVIAILIVFNILPRTNRPDKRTILEKSIAVIPFIDDSPGKDNVHIINGIMEDLLINLQSIKDLRVPGRTSVEQYRNNPKPVPEIAQELGVNYIIEGSGQKLGVHYTLRVQLLEGATGMHIWGRKFEQDIESMEDIVRFISEIAGTIADELQAVITPEEKKLIEKIPTTSLTAYELYQKGQEEFYTYYLDKDKIEALVNAKGFYRSALESDPAFAKAYAGLSQVYWYQLGRKWEGIRPDNCLDSVLIMANLGLKYDDKLVDGYILRGDYYTHSGNRELAIEEYDKALKLNPNHWTAYHQLGIFYIGYDFVKSLQYFYKAASLIHGPEEPAWLRRGIWAAHNHIGLIEKSDSYLLKALKLDGDSLEHYVFSSQTEIHSGNFEKAIALARKGYAIDSNRISILLRLGLSYLYLGQYEEAIKHFKNIGEPVETHTLTKMYLGYAYWRIGSEKEAEKHILENIRRLNKLKEQGEAATDLWIYYALAGGYAFLGEKDKAYENLRIYIKQIVPHRAQVLGFKIDPLFDSIRDEPEFQQIVREAEAKYQAEHERVRKWLEENDML